MFHRLLEAVRAETSGERALESVRDIARFHRVQASPGYDRAADWVAGRLESHGLAVEVERVPADGRARFLGQLMPEGWECSRAQAFLVDGARRERLCDYDAEKLSLVLRSESARGRFRLVAVEDGGEERDYEGVDVRGAVVLTRAPVHRAHALAVLERGAAGLLCDGRRLLPPVRDRMDDPDALAYTSFWWGGDEPRGWGLVVSPRRGDELRERLRSGARLEVEVEIESRRFATEIPLVSAALTGRIRGEVLILAHLCHPQPSANDNASGAAAALEAARVLATLGARGGLGDPAYGVRFLWVPEFTGTYAWLARDERRAPGTVAALNLDMVGQDQERCGSTLLLEHPPCFAATFAEELLRRIRDHAADGAPSPTAAGRATTTRLAEVPYSGGSDHAVLVDPAVGVPCPMLIQWPDRYYHSSHDTPDKSDPRSLALAARCAATYAAFLAGSGGAERAWLLDAVVRGAKRRLLAALDRPEPAREVARERVRAASAIGSLARLGLDARRIETTRTGFDAFADREADVPSPVPPSAAGAERAVRPRRLQRAPLDHHRHLLDGYASLPRGDRERWRALDAVHAGPLLDVAWFACDGRRTLEEIARLAWLETGRHEPGAIAELFGWTARLGLSDASDAGQEAAWSPSAPDTATR